MRKEAIRLLSGFAVICLVLSGASGLADSDTHAIEPTILGGLDKTASEWYSSDDSRALLVASAMLDIFLSENDGMKEITTDAFQNGSVYVGKDGLKLCIFYFGTDDTVLAIYTPYMDSFEAKIQKDMDYSYAIFGMENLVNDELISSYYKVPSEDILDVLELFYKALND